MKADYNRPIQRSREWSLETWLVGTLCVKPVSIGGRADYWIKYLRKKLLEVNELDLQVKLPAEIS